MEEQALQSIVDAAIHFDNNRHYWLVRTQGGDYYDQYKNDEFIAIGYNQIGLKMINDAIINGGDKPIDYLTDHIKKRMPDLIQPGYAAAQLLKFVRDMRKKDIVIIPSENSTKLTIGELTETPIIIDENARYVQQPKSGPMLNNYVKRRKVNWLKEVSRSELDPVLYKLLYSHHIITGADSYANPVDNLLSDFYVKGEETHLVIQVSQPTDIGARTLFDMGSSLLDLVDRFCRDNDLGVDTSDVDIKLNLRSAGKIEFKTRHGWIAAIIGMAIIGITGGGFKIEQGDFKLDLSTPGLIQKIIDYQNHAQLRDIKQQMLVEHMKKLQIQKPEDLVKLLNTEVGEENKTPTPDVDKESKEEEK